MERHPQVQDLSELTFGKLTVLDFAGIGSGGNATWRCRCECGAEAVVAARRLKCGETMSCGCIKAAQRALRRRPEDIGYSAAHWRVRRDRGRASLHVCEDCGRPAAHWSLRHDAVSPMSDDSGHGVAYRYSGDPDDYEPRCARCHVLYDASRPFG